ncbi:MAG: DsrE family protein [Lysobacterales bacterium]
MSRILVVFASSAQRGGRTRDGLELALALLAFEHEVGVLFIGDGVGMLVPDQAWGELGLPESGRALAALAHHGAVRVAASAACLAARGIRATGIPVERLEAAALADLVAEFAHVQRV